MPHKRAPKVLFLPDKLFSSVDTFVDFGCADGSMLHALHTLNSKSRLIGYDKSENMLKIAQEKVPEAEFFSDWEDIDIDFAESCLVLSSVIHEVYSYSTPDEIELFWERVFNSGFKYIAIRDMMFTEYDENAVDITDREKVLRNSEYRKVMQSFEEINGKIDTSKQLLHFLLKYQYFDNWTREVRENYLPLSLEDMMEKISKDYEITYFVHETLPYTASCVKRDFDIELNMKTHAKFILEKKVIEK